MSDDPKRDDLGREIVRSWMHRGEYDKVIEAQGVAYLLFGGIIVVSIVLCVVLSVLGIKW